MAAIYHVHVSHYHLSVITRLYRDVAQCDATKDDIDTLISHWEPIVARVRTQTDSMYARGSLLSAKMSDMSLEFQQFRSLIAAFISIERNREIN